MTLTLNGNEFPTLGKILLQHQAVADSFVCLMAIVLYVQPFGWTTGNKTFDILLCQIWHSQAAYWAGAHISIWGLVLIAMERFLMVKYTLRHRNMRPKHAYIGLAINYISCSIFIIPCYFQARYDYISGECKGEYYYPSDGFWHFMAFYGVWWFVVEYSIQVAIFVILYTKIVMSLRKRTKRHDEAEKELGLQTRNNEALSTAERQLTRMAIYVTIVFVMALGPESWRYLLGRIGLITYDKYLLQLAMGIFPSALNSCANPFIYCMSLTIFRRSLKKTFGYEHQDYQVTRSNET